jgi:hypothetical protein
MRQRSLRQRILALPRTHQLIAPALAIVIACGFWFAAKKLPHEYVSPAFLSFDQTGLSSSTGDTSPTYSGKSVVLLSNAILSDKILSTLGSESQLFKSGTDSDEIARLRERLDLAESSPSVLRVTYRSADKKQAVATANVVANYLAAWRAPESSKRSTPQQHFAPAVTVKAVAPPVAPTPIAASVTVKADLLRPERDRLWKRKLELQDKIAGIDHQLSMIHTANTRPAETVQRAVEDKDHQKGERLLLLEQLSSAKKRLDELRLRYTDEYPDVQKAQARVKEIEDQLSSHPEAHASTAVEEPRSESVSKEIYGLQAARAGLVAELEETNKQSTILRIRKYELEHSADRRYPAAAIASPPPAQKKAPVEAIVEPPPAQDLYPSNFDPEGKKPFTIIQYARSSQISEQSGRWLIWMGGAMGILGGSIYIAFALRWFAAVGDRAMLARVLPADVAYLGAIPGMHP